MLLLVLHNGNRETGTLGLRAALTEEVSEQIGTKLMERFVPVFSFVQEDSTDSAKLFLSRQMEQIMPLYGYGNRDTGENARREDRMTIEMILLAEGSEEGSSGSQEAIDAQNTTASSSDGTNGADITDSSEMGNGMSSGEDVSQVDTAVTGGEENITENTTETGETTDLASLLEAENQAAGGQLPGTAAANSFIPHEIQATVDLDSLQDYETLVKNFYTIDSNTMAGSDQLNTNSLLNQDLTISKESEGPQILIYHTHSQEAFADSIPGDAATTIVGVGDRLTQILTEQYGYQVLHHTGQYDVDSRDDAYSRALPAIEQVLEENPSIQVVIDLHRDAMAEETHLVMDLDGRPTARFMFFNGLSRTRKTGNISYLYNENQAGNLAFSFQMQMKAVQYYPGLTRKIYLKGYRYNMHLRSRTLLIELGAQNNSLEEAMNACDPLAHILDMVLSGE